MDGPIIGAAAVVCCGLRIEIGGFRISAPEAAVITGPVVGVCDRAEVAGL